MPLASFWKGPTNGERYIVIIQKSAAYSTQSARLLAANSQANRQTNPGAAAAFSDKVSISQAAHDLVSSSSTIPTEDYPLDYYAVPQWLADLSPTELSGKLGARADDVYAKGGNLVGIHGNELFEYGKGLDRHLRTLLENEGINSTPEYHKALIVDKDNSNRLYDLLKNSIAGDKKMTDLMSVLGIDFPR